MLICGHSRLFCIKKTMSEQAEGEQLFFHFLSSCQVCDNIRNLMSEIRPLVLQPPASQA